MDEDEFDREDADVYDDEGSEEQLSADEIEEGEEGFMKGYDSVANPAFCDNCEKILTDRDMIERNIHGELYTFCSEECAEQFEKKE